MCEDHGDERVERHDAPGAGWWLPFTERDRQVFTFAFCRPRYGTV
jgi:hypothetical protein